MDDRAFRQVNASCTERELEEVMNLVSSDQLRCCSLQLTIMQNFDPSFCNSGACFDAVSSIFDECLNDELETRE